MRNRRIPSKQPNIQPLLDKASAAFKQHLAAGRYAEAMQEALKAHRLIPKAVVPLSDAATAAVQAGLWPQAVEYAKQALKRNPEHINSLDVLAHAYGALRDWENAGRYGLQALQLRDKSITQTADLPQSVRSGGKNVIAFSLFGASSAYIETAVMNTELVEHIYPGWVCRFYIDDSVPQEAVQRLADNGAEIVRVDEQAAAWPGTMWRFLAMDDPQAGRVIFRDADSVISRREALAVQEWIASGKRFHTLRDAGSHTELILAGLWGAVAGSVPDMRGKIEAYLEKPLQSRHFADQYFLRENVWPYVRQSLYAHDRLFGFAGAHPFPEGVPFDFERFHVGCNEGNSRFEAVAAGADGSRVRWQLFSRISPRLNDDFSSVLLPEERLVCSYEAEVKNGKISGYLPKRYTRGFSDGLTRMTVAPISDAE